MQLELVVLFQPFLVINTNINTRIIIASALFLHCKMYHLLNINSF
jgi:hypothetical protein